MNVETLREVATDLIGNAWQTRLANHLGIDASTVRRWLANGVDAPSYVAAYLELLGDRQETRGALIMERERLGLPISFVPPVPVTLERMHLKLVFPGVEQAKVMPAIHAAFDREGKPVFHLDGAPSDAIVDTEVSYSMVRHPDRRHLKGYIATAADDGHSAVVVSHRFHHYSLVPHHPTTGTPKLIRKISTHAGEIRTLVAEPSAPTTIVESRLGS